MATSNTRTVQLTRTSVYGEEQQESVDYDYKVVAAGTHDWAGGAATTDAISVPGILATDVVQTSLRARAGSEVLELSGVDADDEEIDLTLSANGTDTTTKIDYVVYRAV